MSEDVWTARAYQKCRCGHYSIDHRHLNHRDTHCAKACGCKEYRRG